MINSIENKNFKYSKINDPFNYILMENFLNLDYLKKIDNYFDKMPDTLYVQESVPQSVINKLKTVPFINNSCFVFGQTKDSWHGLDPGKNFSERRVIQLNWVNEEFSSYNDCFPLEV